MPREGQFDLKEVYSKFFDFTFFFFFKALFNFCMAQWRTKKNNIFGFIFPRMGNALANKTSKEFNQAFVRLPILRPNISIQIGKNILIHP